MPDASDLDGRHVTQVTGDVVVGGDGLARCAWGASTPDYLRYHDQEWGRPLHGDDAFFERLTLEAFQSGLSWLTILRKRPAFRAAFAGFSIPAVARFGDGDVARLMADAGIVRNRLKVAAALTNARAAEALVEAEGEGALDRLIWSFAPDPWARPLPPDASDRPRPRAFAGVPAITDESKALAKGLQAHGFVFVGPTTAYALMQACGLVDDHLAGCHRATAAHPLESAAP